MERVGLDRGGDLIDRGVEIGLGVGDRQHPADPDLMVGRDAEFVVHGRDRREPFARRRELAVVEIEHHAGQGAVVGLDLGAIERGDSGPRVVAVHAELGQELGAGQGHGPEQQGVTGVALEAGVEVLDHGLEIRRGPEREPLLGVREARVTITPGREQLDRDADQQEHHEQRHAERDPAKQLATLLRVDVPDQVAGWALTRIDHRRPQPWCVVSPHRIGCRRDSAEGPNSHRTRMQCPALGAGDQQRCDAMSERDGMSGRTKREPRWEVEKPKVSSLLAEAKRETSRILTVHRGERTVNVREGVGPGSD